MHDPGPFQPIHDLPFEGCRDDQFCDVCPDERDVLDGLFWDLQSLAEPPDAPDLLSAESSEVED